MRGRGKISREGGREGAGVARSVHQGAKKRWIAEGGAVPMSRGASVAGGEVAGLVPAGKRGRAGGGGCLRKLEALKHAGMENMCVHRA